MKISVITATFNSEATILTCLDSLNNQTHSNIEHIVVDGASKDGTIALINDNSQINSIVISEPDSGIYDAMNKGISSSTGEIIGFLNSDDFYASNSSLEEVAKVFLDPEIDACYGDLCYVDPVNINSIVRYWQSGVFIPGSFSRSWSPPHPTFFVRRSIISKYGGFDLNFKIAADFELMLRLMECCRIKVSYLPIILVKMRLGGTTNKNLTNIAKQNLEILQALKKGNQKFSLTSFVYNKLASRIKQFISKPTEKINAYE